jgi:phage terminase large subunit-like protein
MTNYEISIKYANDIISKTIPSPIEIQQACQLYLNDIESDLYYFNHKEVDKMVKFSQTFKSTKNKKPIELLPWQIFLISAVYGIYQKSINKRKYRVFVLIIPRGGGKTAMSLMFAMYHFLFTLNSQVVVGASTNRQTFEVDLFEADLLAQQIDPSRKIIKKRINKLIYKNNRLLAISNQADNFEGTAIDFGLIDEFHEFKTLKLYNSIKTSLAKKPDSLMFITSTAGSDINCECYRMIQYCKQILKGEVEDNSIFPLLFGIDENDPLKTDEDIHNAIIKANPSMNLIREDVLASEIKKSLFIESDSEKSSILSRHLNIWTQDNLSDAYILDKYVQRALADISLDDPEFKNIPIFCGADLSKNDDLTSVSYMLIKDGIYHFFNDYYINSNSITTKKNKDRYAEAAEQGYINIIEGDAIDYNVVIDHINKRNNTNHINLIGYDKFNAAEFIKRLLALDYNLVTISQLPSGMHKPLMEMQRLFLLDKVRVQRNPLTPWQFSNVELDRKSYGLIALDKKSDSAKVDVVASMGIALGAYLIAPEFGFNIW